MAGATSPIRMVPAARPHLTVTGRFTAGVRHVLVLGAVSIHPRFVTVRRPPLRCRSARRRTAGLLRLHGPLRLRADLAAGRHRMPRRRGRLPRRASGKAACATPCTCPGRSSRSTAACMLVRAVYRAGLPVALQRANCRFVVVALTARSMRCPSTACAPPPAPGCHCRRRWKTAASRMRASAHAARRRHAEVAETLPCSARSATSRIARPVASANCSACFQPRRSGVWRMTAFSEVS